MVMQQRMVLKIAVVSVEVLDDSIVVHACYYVRVDASHDGYSPPTIDLAMLVQSAFDLDVDDRVCKCLGCHCSLNYMDRNYFDYTDHDGSYFDYCYIDNHHRRRANNSTTDVELADSEMS